MIDIVSRAQWGARSPRQVNSMPIPSQEMWLHHTADSNRGAAGMRAIQNFHMDVQGWFDIAYSFVVDPDGTIFEGRGAGVQGGHTEGRNAVSHAICVMGNYQKTAPTQAALDSIVALMRHGFARGWWPQTITGGHRDAPFSSTKCPGVLLHAKISELNDRLLQDEEVIMSVPDYALPSIEKARAAGVFSQYTDPAATVEGWELAIFLDRAGVFDVQPPLPVTADLTQVEQDIDDLAAETLRAHLRLDKLRSI